MAGGKDMEPKNLNILKQKSYKIRIYPNSTQKIQIEKTFGCTRKVYNTLLGIRISRYSETKKSMSKLDMNNYCNSILKTELPYLREVDKWALTNSIFNLDKAYHNFFNNSDKFKFPNFKSKNSKNLSYTTTYNNKNIKVFSNAISLPKLKKVKARISQEVLGYVKTATVTKTGSGKYFVCINVEKEIENLPNIDSSIGIDVGIQTFATTYNGKEFEEINNPKFYRKEEIRLQKLHRKVSRKVKGSKNRNKDRLKLAKSSEKVANRRSDFQHKLSTRLIIENQVIYIEDLNVSGMLKNHCLAKSIADCSWSEFVRQLTYKADWYGRTINKVDRFYSSSKICSHCGEKNILLTLKDRTWVCNVCGSVHDRDKNASKNIRTAGTAGIYACGDISSTSELVRMQEKSVKQELIGVI